MAIQSSSNHFDIVRSITCRVVTPNAMGTGIILSGSNNDEVYLITAKHCLLGKDFSQDVQSEDITVYVPSIDEEHHSISLEHSSQILFPSDTNLDIAIIQVKQPAFKAANVPLLDVRYFQQECFFRGYPRADAAQLGVNIPVNFVDNSIVSTQTSLETYDSVSYDNCDGFSGSGVFGLIDQTPYFVGLLYELKEPFRRFSLYNLSQINSVLSENGLPILPASDLPISADIQKDIRRLERKSKSVLDSIKDTFDDQFNLPRENVIPQFNTVLLANRLIILKGDAGAGKSAFAKSQLKVLQDEGYKILAFKADWFAKESVEEILPAINGDLQDLLISMGSTQQVVILIDSLEKLLEAGTDFALKEFLQICKSLPYVKLIITCRSYAYQQLIFDLHYDFPTFSFVDIPLLTDNELQSVSNQFSSLANLLGNTRFRDILRRPFYLNLVIRHKDVFPQDPAITELKFRELIWSRIIENGSRKRASTFEKIAIERATKMSLFVRLDGLDGDSLQALVYDGLLEVDEITNDSYRPSHDIYEDIALIRYVARAFQDKQNTDDFFVRIDGKTPAKRRGFRLWLNEALIEPQKITGFIHDVFESRSISKYWLDELIIAILRSDYCEILLEHNERLLLVNDQSLLLRFIHLLRTTCQEPDEKLIQALQNRDDQNLYQWMYLKPVGTSWAAIIKFIDKHFGDLSKLEPLILHLLTEDWSKKVQFGLELPSESGQAGTILLHFVEEVIESYRTDKKVPYSTKLINKSVEVLFQLTKCFEVEVRNLIEEANIFTKKAKERYRHREHRFTFHQDSIDDDEYDEAENYHLRDFYQTIIKFVLSGMGNQTICSVMPDLLCKVAKEQWLADESYPIVDRYSIMDRSLEFGLANLSDLDYFPSGIYKTPLRFLLYSHPVHALKLIVDVFNHCTKAYADSQRGNKSDIVEVAIIHNDGTHTLQVGNSALWGAFRGTAQATDLLESLLMSLESWLFELCELRTDWADGWISTSYTYLLKNSTSVAITAVLASVAQAYPHRIKTLSFPILRVREFFEWDINRWTGEQVPLAIYDKDIPFAQAERRRSNQLPHRKNHLEFLATKLQIEGYFTEICEIIDEHTKRCAPDDLQWKLVLNRMDARKFVVEETTEPLPEDQILLRPVIDDEFQDFVEENAKEFGMQNKAMGIINWAIALLGEKPGIDSSYDKWNEAFSTYKELKGIEVGSVKLFRDPAPLAATGIKCFKEDMTTEQLLWCTETLVEVILDRVSSNMHRVPYSGFFINYAIETIPHTLGLDIGDELKSTVKQVVFLSLLYLVNNKAEYPFKIFRNSVWKIDSEYANACLAGMIQFARLIKQRKWYTQGTSKANEEHAMFLKQVQTLAERVSANQIIIDMTNLSFDTCSDFYLSFAIQVIPFDTNKPEHHELLSEILQLHIEWNNDKRQRRHRDDLSFDAQIEVQRYVAKFILLQSENIGRRFFIEVLDSVFSGSDSIAYDCVKYVAQVLENIIIEQDSLQSESFWSIWGILEDRIRQSSQKRYVSYLLLSHQWWNSKADRWIPLQNKSLVMRRLVTEFGEYDLKAVLKLLSGIGTEELMPDGLNWLRIVLERFEDPKQELIDSDIFFYAEKLIQRTYYRYIRDIKRDHQLQQSLLVLLDLMMDAGSSLAFVVRERLITT